MATSPQSPLTEASSASLDEYFSRRPPYDGTTLNAIKAELRRLREHFQKNEAEGKPTRAKKAPKAQSMTQADIFALPDPEGQPPGSAS